MRPSWGEYFLSMLNQVASRSTCIRRQLGAIVVSDSNRILTTGYNASPSGVSHCNEKDYCLRREMNIPSGERHELCKAVHAEQNAITQAANAGIPLKDSHIFISNTPCVICAKLIINAGIKEIYVAETSYPDKLALKLLIEARIPLYWLKEGKTLISQQCLQCKENFWFRYVDQHSYVCKKCHAEKYPIEKENS